MTDASSAVNWRRRGRVWLALLAATAAALALLAALDARLGATVTAVAEDPTASFRAGRLAYCPRAGDPCCAQLADPTCLRPLELATEARMSALAIRWLAVDAVFAVLYAVLVGLACVWAAPLFGVRARWGWLFAAVAVAAATADLVENAALAAVLRGVAAPAPAEGARALAAVGGCLKWGILAPLAFLVGGLLWFRSDLVGRHLAYFAVLRPTFVFAAVLLYLPLSAIETAPLSSMLGNLLVDYDFWRAFWLGLTLFPAVWSVMFTAGLLLDSERKRDDRWVHDPGEAERSVTLPIRDPWIVAAFTGIALPTVVVVAWTAPAPGWALAGILVGGVVAYATLDLSLSILSCAGGGWRFLPWRPQIARLFSAATQARCARAVAGFGVLAAAGARVVRLPSTFFTNADRAALEGDHVFAAWSLAAMFALYLASSVALWLVVRADCFKVLYDLPPAGFLYVLLLWMVWLVSLVWFLFRRYRLALVVVLLVGGGLSLLSGHRGTSYTYDVSAVDVPPLTPSCVLHGLAPGDPVIVVAASGGGIAAAGWTAKVLAELHQRIPDFRRTLRLLSTVSGGSVGSAHYLNALRQSDARGQPVDGAALARMVAKSMDTSLSATAYAFAFPELRRMVLPFFVGESSDRGRLQERTWRWRADCGDDAAAPQLADFSTAVYQGTQPAVIFNATLMETGGRVAITNLAPLPDGGDVESPPRLRAPRTLSQLLNDGPASREWTTGLWTGARLSATFSYVSPAAAVARDDLAPAARRHLIDGGYHDNFGVASALDWIEAALPEIGDRKIALVEIRASPQAEAATPEDGLVAEWLGPVLGMWNSWWRSQTETNDTAVHRLERRLGPAQFRSFVFVPQAAPPLSWHLSRAQQRQICGAWGMPHPLNQNPQQLRALLAFLGQADGEGPDRVTCEVENPCP